MKIKYVTTSFIQEDVRDGYSSEDEYVKMRTT
jgi:hypothetical protein